MTRPPAILALVTDAFGGRGGIAQYNRDFITALVDAAGAAVTVLPRHTADPVAPSRPAIVQHPARPGRIAYSLAALRAALAQPVDIVFCGHLYMAPLGFLIARVKHARLIVQTHGIDAWSRPSAIRRTAVEAADLVLTASRYTRSRILSWARLTPEAVRILPNTVGDRFTPGDAGPLRERLELRGRKVLLTIGRMAASERYKGHDRVIEALPRLVADRHDVVYLIAGEGDDRSRLEALAEARGVADRCRFLGAVSPDEVLQLYRMADLFVMPSTGEGFGIAYVEAMACGTPAVGLAVGGATDALGDGDLGAAVAEAQLGEGLSRLLASPPENGAGLAARVRARFGRERFAERVRLMVGSVASPA